jgi:cysteinyl-tRNA synthetase
MKDFIDRLRLAHGSGISLDSYIEETRATFKEALADDLNISVALAALFDFIKKTNALIDAEKISQKEAQKALVFLEELDTVLAVFPLKQESLEIPPAVQEAFDKREAARASKDWAEADKQRNFIHAQGFFIEDSPTGSRVKKQ